MDNSIDQQFVEYVVKSLVGKPEKVEVKRSVDEKGVLLELTVDPEDLGRVIGKRGATAQSLRALLRALGTKNEARYNLKIIDNGAPAPAKKDDTSAPVASDDAVAQDDTAAARSNDASSDSDDDVVMPEDEEVKLQPESKTDDDRLSKTRRELADLDDLDI